MRPLPSPTEMAARAGEPGAPMIASRHRLAITTPTQFETTDFMRPTMPPPQAKNEAQAMKVTQTGIGSTVAVR